MTTAGLVFTILGVVVGLAAVIWAAAQYRFSRRRTVQISRTKTLLVRQGLGASNIEVRLREHEVIIAKPYSVAVKLTAQRPNDVPVEAFGGRPLRVEFGAPVVSLIDISGHPDASTIATEWRKEFAFDREVDLPFVNFIELPPALLSIAAPWTITALCDGEPDPRIQGALANVDFITAKEAQARARNRAAGIGVATFGAGLLVAVIVSFVKGAGAAAPYFILAAFLSGASFPLVLPRSTIRTEEF